MESVPLILDTNIYTVFRNRSNVDAEPNTGLCDTSTPTRITFVSLFGAA